MESNNIEGLEPESVRKAICLSYIAVVGELMNIDQMIELHNGGMSASDIAEQMKPSFTWAEAMATKARDLSDGLR